MNGEKYMNSKNSFLFTTFFLLVLQDVSLTLHTWSPSHCTFMAFCLLAHQDSNLELCHHPYLYQMIST